MKNQIKFTLTQGPQIIVNEQKGPGGHCAEPASAAASEAGSQSSAQWPFPHGKTKASYNFSREAGNPALPVKSLDC